MNPFLMSPVVDVKVYQIDYQIIMCGGTALVKAESEEEALSAFHCRDESIKQVVTPTPQTTIKRITKIKG